MRTDAAFFLEANEWRAAQRDAREGWSLLTVDTEANEDRVLYIGKGSFLVGWFIGLVVPVQKIFILPWLLYTVIHFISTSARFGICTVVGLNETLVEDKMRTF